MRQICAAPKIFYNFSPLCVFKANMRGLQKYFKTVYFQGKYAPPQKMHRSGVWTRAGGRAVHAFNLYICQIWIFQIFQPLYWPNPEYFRYFNLKSQISRTSKFVLLCNQRTQATNLQRHPKYCSECKSWSWNMASIEFLQLNVYYHSLCTCILEGVVLSGH